MEKKENLHAGHRRRKKEQFLKYGLDAFAPHEALELLLFYAIPRVDTNALAHALLTRFGSLDGVFKAPVEELCRVEGIGENAALLLRLVPQIYRRSQTELDKPGQAIRTSDEAGAFFKKYFWSERNELLLELCLDGKFRLLADAVRFALADNAMFVYLAHNHPSGLALPSEADCQATMAVETGLRTMGIRLLDHIIVAENDYTSMADSGLLSGGERLI